ncbi:hypothetical protein BDV96DRAFT_607680 [Lophiotrema nucula]|uniref:Ankyrin repeat-containing domain protein n=1 Tax=Lophiotrema nucula TaxID=690887 RepID=A0A6A5YGT3_9PLEO|nr:hypothetical protein BDV96DRAFT_607680 [Lophiotrema nucula]
MDVTEELLSLAITTSGCFPELMDTVANGCDTDVLLLLLKARPETVVTDELLPLLASKANHRDLTYILKGRPVIGVTRELLCAAACNRDVRILKELLQRSPEVHITHELVCLVARSPTAGATGLKYLLDALAAIQITSELLGPIARNSELWSQHEGTIELLCVLARVVDPDVGFSQEFLERAVDAELNYALLDDIVTKATPGFLINSIRSDTPWMRDYMQNLANRKLNQIKALMAAKHSGLSLRQ